MLKSNRSLRYLLLSLIALTTGLAQAEETRWYDVEVILFAQTSDSYRSSESWPVDYATPDTSRARTLRGYAGRSGKPVAFTMLGSSALRMNREAARVEKASDLELLAHFGWRQPGLESNRSIAVRIGDYLPGAEKLGNYPASELPPGVASKPRLEGTLRLVLSRYLHIQTDLLYREPNENASAVSVAAPANGLSKADATDLVAMANDSASADPSSYHVYRMEESRRMRSTELHYLDHPVFGMIIRVTPYK